MTSIYTPTHNPKYLKELSESIKKQTSQDFEWVIYVNGEKKEQVYEEVNNIVSDNPRAKVFLSDIKGIQNIGAVKRQNVEKCSGDLLVEVDHDDVLPENAIEELIKAAQHNPKTVFFYSNFAQINHDSSPNYDRFGAEYGWGDKYRETEVNGQKYNECVCFEPHPHNFARIYSQPNHIRAFRKKAYDKIGGYADMDILDDQDLISRLYVEGEFFHLDKLLYLQRIHPDNSQKQYYEKITGLCEELYLKYIEDMAIAWAKRHNLRLLDFGGGYRKKEGYETIDMHDADIIADITKGLPMIDRGSVGVIRAVDFLEHIPNKIQIINLIGELLAEGGMLLSKTPSTDGWGAFSDPTHVAYYNERSFWYYTRSQKIFVPEIKATFQESFLKTLDTSVEYGENNKHVFAFLIKTNQKNKYHGKSYFLNP